MLTFKQLIWIFSSDRPPVPLTKQRSADFLFLDWHSPSVSASSSQYSSIPLCYTDGVELKAYEFVKMTMEEVGWPAFQTLDYTSYKDIIR